MKAKRILPLLLSLALLAFPLAGCSPQPEPVFPDPDTTQITSGEVHNWSSSYWTEMTQEDVARMGPLLQALTGTPLPDAQPEPITGGTPTVRITLADGNQLTADLYGVNGIDLIVTTPEGETCYDVEEEQLAPIREIIQSYDPPQIP